MVNIMLGNLKTAINGTYHAFKFAKYAPRYLAEFQYRFQSAIRPTFHPAQTDTRGGHHRPLARASTDAG
ncbi:ISXo5 transposase [Salinisphaera hydrothermalis EPR70]